MEDGFFICDMNDNPIGFFDSGVGGTSIWKEVVALLPNENTIYIADSVNAPYGIKTKEEIIQLSIRCTERLIEQNCKIIVVACNTATTNAIDHLRTNFNIPFIGIEPAIKPALLKTKTKTIGILATKGTLSSSLFESTKNEFGEDIKIIEQIGTGIVELIEANQLESKELFDLVTSYVEPMVSADIDCLVLGCTHYPYLKPILTKILPQDIQLIDSGAAVAKQTKRILIDENLESIHSNAVNHLLLSNGNIETLQALTKNEALQISYKSFEW